MQTDTAPEMTRFVELNNWIFEIKSIRAIKVDNYGDPYKATANLCVNNDSAYVDGVMTRDQSDLEQEDYVTFMQLCEKLGISKVKFDTFNNQNIFDTLKEQSVENEAAKIA
jgi:hypothetical protein